MGRLQWQQLLLLAMMMMMPCLMCISNATQIDNHRYITDKRLTADVNLERYFILEEDLMANVEALLRDDYFEAADGESEEEHKAHKPDLTPIEGAINRTKAIHMEAVNDITTYLSHPINVYHLLRRLDTEWKTNLDVVLKTRLCKEWKIPGMVRHLRYVRKRLPSVDELNSVIHFLVQQLNVFGPHDQEVLNGKVGDHLAAEPLSIDDQYIIAQSLHEQEDFLSAVHWLELVNDWLTKADQDEKDKINFNMTSVLKMMANAYYQVKNPSASVTTTKRLLKLEPMNKLARSNLAFFQRKAEKQKEDVDAKISIKSRKSKFERICTGQIMNKLSRHKCVLEPEMEQPCWIFHKKEILKRKPPIYLYHDFIGKKTADELKDYSFNTMSDRSWTSDYFRTPHLRLVLNYPLIYPFQLRKKAKRIARRLRHCPRPNPLLLKSWGHLQVFTSGLEGMHLKDYIHKLDLVPVLDKDEREVGAFFLFLSEAKQGGQVVMTSRDLVIHPTKGSVLFYSPTRSKPHSYCPSIGGAVWTAVQPFYNSDSRMCRALRRHRER